MIVLTSVTEQCRKGILP